MRTDRIEKILKGMREHGMDQMIISDPSTLYYLTGRFAPSGGRLFALCLDTQGGLAFFMNTLQTDYARMAGSAEIVWYSDSDDQSGFLPGKSAPAAVVGVDRNLVLRFSAGPDVPGGGPLCVKQPGD